MIPMSTAEIRGADWFHGGLLGDGRSLHDKRDWSGTGWLHLGTREAALRRIDPACWDPEFGWVPHARLYRLRLVPGIVVCPELHSDQDDAGSLYFRCDVGDVHAYINECEDPGSLSLAIRPHRAWLVADEGRHPKWTDTKTRTDWYGLVAS